MHSFVFWWRGRLVLKMGKDGRFSSSKAGSHVEPETKRVRLFHILTYLT